MGKYINLYDLEVYKLAKKLSEIGWKIYSNFDWETKKTAGFQFIDAVDSVGANIAEGYNRFHFLDRIKFYYNSRGSLSEANDHWIELINERGKINKENYQKFKEIAAKLNFKLNNFINSTYKAKTNLQTS